MEPVTTASAQTPLILTIDLGTSSARVLLFDATGRPLAGIGAQERYDVRVSAEGASEDDPDAAIERIARCIDTVLGQAGRLASQIGAVAVDTLVSNMLAIDAAGQPLTPLITYADTRNADDALALRQALDERAVHQRTGCLLRTSYWPARLAWMRRANPTIWRAAARWITIGEYLELCLFGECRAGLSAAAWGGLLDRRALVYDAPLLEHLGLPAERLSPLADLDAPLRGLRATYAARWPALRDLPWLPAIGDGAAANIGSGASAPGQVALTVGTTGALRVVLPSVAEVPAGLWCYRVDRRRALLGGATSEGGNVYAWLRQTLQLGSPAAIEAELAALPADGHGLTVLPFVAGERSPGWAGDVRATIHGLGLSSAPIAIVRACLEAVAYRFALIFAQLEAAGSAALTGEMQIIASGGALLSSPAWMQIIADTLGRSVTASDEQEATSRGVALLALEALGTIGAPEQLPAALGATYTPDPQRHAIYLAAIERQRALYQRFYAP